MKRSYFYPIFSAKTGILWQEELCRVAFRRFFPIMTNPTQSYCKSLVRITLTRGASRSLMKSSTMVSVLSSLNILCPKQGSDKQIGQAKVKTVIMLLHHLLYIVLCPSQDILPAYLGQDLTTTLACNIFLRHGGMATYISFGEDIQNF